MHIISRKDVPTPVAARWLRNKENITYSDSLGVQEVTLNQGTYARLIKDYDETGRTVVLVTTTPVFFGAGPAGAPASHLSHMPTQHVLS